MGSQTNRPDCVSAVRHWSGRPAARALFVAVLLAAILLPYWYLAVQWSEGVLASPEVQFTFAATTFLFVLIIADNAFLVRYYQLKRHLELLQKTEDLQRSEDALRRAVKKLNLLSSITRHDILNQLTVLTAYLELTRDSCTDPTVHGYLDKGMVSLNHIHRQIEFTQDYEDLGFRSPVWQSVQETVRHAAGAVNLGSVALSSDFGGLEIFADPLLERVFSNLFANAVRHGQKISQIQCSAHESGDAMVLVVEDDGVGIPKKEKENIFNRRYFRHTGYGLLLSREILSITGITISEIGVSGSGARFEIVIPHGIYRFAGKTQ
jgi:signal transduction histidine kinase